MKSLIFIAIAMLLASTPVKAQNISRPYQGWGEWLPVPEGKGLLYSLDCKEVLRGHTFYEYEIRIKNDGKSALSVSAYWLEGTTSSAFNGLRIAPREVKRGMAYTSETIGCGNAVLITWKVDVVP